MSKNRREFLIELGFGVVYASGLVACASAAKNDAVVGGENAPKSAPPVRDDFYFVQMSDTHWGFQGPPNPEAGTTLGHAIEQINALLPPPDFVVLTGDITQTTDDPQERRRRMREAKSILSALEVKDVRFLPGEHDAAPDAGEAFHEVFGESHYSFDHKGIHFVALDNVSDSGAAVGEPQIAWLQTDLAKVPRDQPVVVFAHRPLFPLFPVWDWHTIDGDDVLQVLSSHDNVTVFYGHIHQEHHHMTGRIAHHAARSLIFPLPAPGSVPKKLPLPWDASAKDHGLGFRQIEVDADADGKRIAIVEHPLA